MNYLIESITFDKHHPWRGQEMFRLRNVKTGLVSWSCFTTYERAGRTALELEEFPLKIRAWKNDYSNH